MSDEGVTQTPTVFSSKERAALVAKALSEAARRARFSTKRRRSLTAGGLRARRGEQIMRMIRIWSFVAVVAIPCTVYGLYIYLVASNQYVAEARFTIRGGMPPSMDQVGSLVGAPAMLIVQDTQIIMNYLQSRALLEDLNRKINFRSLYEKKSIDYFSRLPTDYPIEKVIKYWKWHSDVSIELPAGIVELYVRAFSPEDASKVANAALDSAEEVVNRMNDKMAADAVSVAEIERKRAEARVVQTRTKLEQARNSEGLLNAEAASTGMNTLMDQVKTQMITMQQNYDAQRRTVSADAPQLKNLKTKIDAAKNEVAKLEAQITETKTSPDASGDPKKRVLSGSMTRLDYAQLEDTIAEQIYAAAVAGVEQARVASEIKLMYVTRFIDPVAPESSKEPKRSLFFSLFVLASLSLWGAVVGLSMLARNQVL